MARAPSSILIFLRHNHCPRQNPNTEIRYLTIETEDSDFTEIAQQNGFLPDPISCNVVFTALVEVKACNAAKSFLELTGFSPDLASVETYIGCLCEGGYVQKAVYVFYRLKGAGVCPSIMTWKALSGYLEVGRSNIIRKLYQEMIECGVVADVDVLVDGLVPGNAAFNKLISGFCKVKNYTTVSELIHIMIAKNRVPDNYTYQEVINWLCKKGRGREGLRVFNDLKDKGYVPDTILYTNMIHGLCTMGYTEEARKLWFEMIEKGYHPNE
ncbi:hypothetical protein C1H46_030462 [Malus baccata]|uniref:Pentacotripeptide-repeat region of PRORP domain-containing protein n=1 Tax=Malus baccata TaxID=106549 RepID=A0A540LCK3_MALBA|nr:hypothetical protein C1H46_030462 [Malus baccata]